MNSNFFLVSGNRRWFLRIYEEQGPDGVAYEWALLDHLTSGGVPVPRRVAGPPPGDLRVADRPVAVFEVIGGTMSCQAGVTPARAAAVGAILAETHRVTADFAVRRRGRFTLEDIARRLESPEVRERSELAPAVAAATEALDEVQTSWPPDLPLGVVHGDLFRDNVHWEADRIVALIDWESASDGALVYDLAVTLLAWCWADDLDWDLARALIRGYTDVRPPSPEERAALRLACMAAATRFTATRITDYYLRDGIGERVIKDYRRFLRRLEAIGALDADTLARHLW